MRREQRGYGNLPIIVLSESEQGDLQENKDARDDPFTTAQQHAAWRVGLQLKERIAKLSTDGKNVIVKGSTHLIQLDHPDAVISAVRQVLDKVHATAANPSNGNRNKS